jgi:molybdopterin-guanine dinucleotide biosynthesis protein A
VLRFLTHQAAGARGVIPLWNERLQPLVALYHRTLAASIDALLTRGERRTQAVAALPGVRVIDAERLAAHDPEGWSFRSLNTPEEYADALGRWADAGGADE